MKIKNECILITIFARNCIAKTEENLFYLILPFLYFLAKVETILIMDVETAIKCCSGVAL